MTLTPADPLQTPNSSCVPVPVPASDGNCNSVPSRDSGSLRASASEQSSGSSEPQPTFADSAGVALIKSSQVISTNPYLNELHRRKLSEPPADSKQLLAGGTSPSTSTTRSDEQTSQLADTPDKCGPKCEFLCEAWLRGACPHSHATDCEFFHAESALERAADGASCESRVGNGKVNYLWQFRTPPSSDLSDDSGVQHSVSTTDDVPGIFIQ